MSNKVAASLMFCFALQIFAEETATLAKRQHNATVFITLTDTNEYDPVFTPPRFRGNVSETSAIDTSVLQVSTDVLMTVIVVVTMSR